jgi:hypothetical protein
MRSAGDNHDNGAVTEEPPSSEPTLDIFLFCLPPATGKGLSYTLRSIGRELSKSHNRVELVAPYGTEKSAGNYRVNYTCPNALRDKLQQAGQRSPTSGRTSRNSFFTDCEKREFRSSAR